MIRLAVRVEAARAELALAELLELVPDGVEEVALADGRIEYAVYGAPGELPALPALRAAAGDGLVEVSSSDVPDDWHERWRRFHRPVLIASPATARVPGLYVRPPWEASLQREGVQELVIDPGQAFGTGGHATTQLCLELLLALVAEGGHERGALLDVGTGSGVLAIAAAKLGYAPVAACDHDRLSIAAAAENARRNGVHVELAHLDLRSAPVSAPVAATGPTVVMANLLRPLLLDLARRLSPPSAASVPPVSPSALGSPVHLIAGGLLREEADEVIGAFAQRLGLCERERRERGEWAAVWLAQAGSGSSVAARTIAR